MQKTSQGQGNEPDCGEMVSSAKHRDPKFSLSGSKVTKGVLTSIFDVGTYPLRATFDTRW